MRAKLVLVLASRILMMGLHVRAHHSFAAEFDIDKPVTLKGTLTKMSWVNPHGWIYIDVKEPDGKVTNWAVEAGAPNALLRRGLRNSDFPVGTEVVVEGYRAKNGSDIANGGSVVLADGKKLFVGSSGTGAPYEEKEKK